MSDAFTNIPIMPNRSSLISAMLVETIVFVYQCVASNLQMK
jgi:hypothetical protein